MSGWTWLLLTRWQDLRGTGYKCFRKARAKAQGPPALAKVLVARSGTEIAEGKL